MEDILYYKDLYDPIDDKGTKPNDKINKELENVNRKTIDTTKQWSVRCRNIDNEWWLFGVYGPNSFGRRQEWWEQPVGLYGLCYSNWCMGGDFNVVMFLS